MFGLTCTFFIGNIILLIMSCAYYPNRFRDYHVDPSRAVFMGAFSMGYITIVNFIALITKGEHIYFVWTLWWLAVFFSHVHFLLNRVLVIHVKAK